MPLDHRLRLRTYCQPAPSHCPHGFSSRVPVARQAGQASQSALFAALPMTPVQRLPAVTCEHCPLIISGEYDNAPQRVQTATGCGFWLDPCSGLLSGVSSGMEVCNRLRICLFWKRSGHDWAGNHRVPSFFATSAKHFFTEGLIASAFLDHRERILFLASRAADPGWRRTAGRAEIRAATRPAAGRRASTIRPTI